MALPTTNLFVRLSRYSLKENAPLENFCTELLAWCLQNSLIFQKEFLKTIELNILRGFEGRVLVSTQQYWNNVTNSENDEGRCRQSGFFDLVIESYRKEFLIAIESKIESDFGKNQLEDYKKELVRIKKECGIKDCYLVTLTKKPWKSTLADAHVAWSQIQDLLVKTQIEDTQHPGIFKQFADFLKEKGISPMKIDKLDGEVLKSWEKCGPFQSAIWQILDNLSKSEELVPFLGFRGKPEFWPDRNKQDLGIWGNGRPLDWLGFTLTHGNDTPKLEMMVSGAFNGNILESQFNKRLGPSLKRARCEHEFVAKNNQTWLNFYLPIDAEFNGNADKIFDWLSSAAQEFSDIKFE